MRVLLVEDDALLADGMIRSLKQAAYTVDWTPDGEEAEAILRVLEFDLVILDLTLPKLDGLEILRVLRQATATWHPPARPPSTSRCSSSWHGIKTAYHDFGLTNCSPFRTRCRGAPDSSINILSKA